MAFLLEIRVKMADHILEFWQSTATISIGIIITLLGFWVGIGRKIVSRNEIADMIKNESVYNQDRQFIMERLSTHKEDHKTITLMLDRNTAVMHELKIQIATLGKTLEALEKRIER
jgi:hypothetical protein